MASLIEQYDHSDARILVGARSYPTECVFEDDDGIRWYLRPSLHEPVPAAQYARAIAAGASVLVAPAPASGWDSISIERFMDERTESRGEYRITPVHAGRSFPSYLAVVGARSPEPVEGAGTRKGFVHLHTHSEFSPWDGLSTIEEICTEATADGQPAVGITDHGFCSGHPELAKQAKKFGIKPVFGLEAYLADDRFARKPDPIEVTGEDGTVTLVQPKDKPYNHLILLAQNDVGLRNVWSASTESHRDGFYHKPRMDWDTLARHSEGVIASTGCLSGPLAACILKDDEEGAKVALGKLLAIFGDRLYMEIHANSLPEQRKVNEALVAMAKTHGVPMLGVVDSHFPTAESASLHRTWMACATGNEVVDDNEILGFNERLYVQSEAEVRESMAYLGESVVDECVANTVAIADSCDASLRPRGEAPVFSRVGDNGDTSRAARVAKDEERLLDLCLSNWSLTEGKGYSQEVAEARFTNEYRLLVQKGFCGYFLLVADYVGWAKTQARILVGPGRGSGGGSLAAYLSRITAIDPIAADLLFDRFMTEGRTSLPDFDVDFPSSKRVVIQDYVRQRWGDDHVVRVGTHTRLRNKGVFKSLGKALAATLPPTWFVDSKRIAKMIDGAEASTAGLGLSWDDLMVQIGDDLAPYRERYPDVFEYAERFVGRINSYGKHAAGLVISTDEPLEGNLPLYGGRDGEPMVSQFDMRTLEELNYVKADFLNIRNLDTIQGAIDLISQRGIEIDPDLWGEEYEDSYVWEQVGAGHTLGIFQIETGSGTALAKKFRPQSLSELSDMITLVRPGPTRSGLTATYMRRRAGIEPVSVPDPRLEPVLNRTWGTILYQEDVMATCMTLGGYDSNEADSVRKILGKKQVEKVAAEGVKFVDRTVTNGMAVEASKVLFAQIAEFAKYSFNRAHAWGYAMLGYWCAWLKFNYPVEFMIAALSTVEKDEVPLFVKEARRMGFQVLPPDINVSGVGFRGDTMAVRYGLDAIKGIGEETVKQIVSGQPYTSYQDFTDRMFFKDSKVNLGHAEKLVRIGAFDSVEPNRRGLVGLVTDVKSKANLRCQFMDPTFVSPFQNPDGQPLPCHFDWSSEVFIGRTGKPIKPKPLPKKCSRACRQYVQVEAYDVNDVTDYTDADIREIEQEMLGLYLSSTPFDTLPAEDRDLALDQALMVSSDGPINSQNTYLVAGIVTSSRAHMPPSGKRMGFLTLETEGPVIDLVVFNEQWVRHEKDFVVGALAYADVRRNDKGISLTSFYPA